MVTSAKAWRQAREEGIEVTFPSGNVAAICPVEVDLFLRVGRIPDSLVPMMLTALSGNSYKLEVPLSEKVEQSKEWVEFLNDLVVHAFVSPKVVIGTPQDDEQISVDDVTYNDKLFLYQFFTRPAQVLRRFRDGQTEYVASLETATNNGSQSKQNAQD